MAIDLYRFDGNSLPGSSFGVVFFFSSRRRHTRCSRDWSSDVCSSDLLIDACYLRGGLDDRSLDDAQQPFSDGDVDRWAQRVDDLKDGEGVRIAAAIHSVRAVDPASMRTVAAWARKRGAPLH